MPNACLILKRRFSWQMEIKNASETFLGKTDVIGFDNYKG